MIRVILYFGDKSCFLTEKPKVGYKDQMELTKVGKVLTFKSRVSKVKTGQTTSEFTIISPKNNVKYVILPHVYVFLLKKHKKYYKKKKIKNNPAEHLHYKILNHK